MALQTEQEKNAKAVADFMTIAQSQGYDSVQTQQMLYNNADKIKAAWGEKRGNEIISSIQSQIKAPERSIGQTAYDQWQSALGAVDAMQQPFMDFFDPSSDWAKENRAERQAHLNNVSEAQQLRNLQAQHNLAQAQANGDWGIAARIQNIASDPFVQTADLAAQALPAAGLLGATYLSGGTLAPVTVPALFGMGAVQGVGGARGDLYEATIAQDDQVLQNHNAEYRQLRQSGMSEAEAKNIVGTNIQEHLGELALSGASGAILERFGLGKALRGQGSALRNLAGEIVSEAADEGVQTALANNMKTAVNPNQNLWENVPLAMFEGALMGGMSGALAATLSPKNSTTAPVADTADQILQAAEQAQSAKIQAEQAQSDLTTEQKTAQTTQTDVSEPVAEALKPEAAQTFRQPETQTEPSALQQAAQATTATGKVATGEQANVDIGKDTQAVTWEIREASDLGASIDKAQNQFRDRTRAASQAQIQQIAQKPDYRYLNNSPVMDYGAPTLAQDGSTIIGGNGRTAGLKQAYTQGTAEQYRADLIANAQQYGFTPEQIAEFEQPVLVRRLNNQVDVQQAAIASNEGGGLAMSALEQAKADATRLPPLDAFTFSETGSLNTGTNSHAIQQWVKQFPQNQQAALQDGQGRLSQTGENRLQNAILYQAYSDSPTLARQIESTSIESRNIANALTQSANTVAQAKSEIAYGNLHDLDIADDLTEAADIMEQLRAQGASISDWLAQEHLMTEIAPSPEARILVKYFNDHIRSAKAMRDLITTYYDEVQNLGNPNQADMFGDNIVPTKTELLSKVIQNHENDTTNQSKNPSERAEQSSLIAPDLQPETQSPVRTSTGQSDTESRANAEVNDFRQPETENTGSLNDDYSADDEIRHSRSAMKSVEANIARGQSAMNKALLEKTTTHRAMYRQDIGWVDFIWGNIGRVRPNGKTRGAMGISHIFESRMRKDQMSEQDVIQLLTKNVPETIAKGATVSRHEIGNAIALDIEHDGYRVSLKKQKGSNAWMLTAFELHEGANGKGYDNTVPTDTNPTLSRVDTGASHLASDSEQTAETVSHDTQTHSQRSRGLGAENNENVTDIQEKINQYQTAISGSLKNHAHLINVVSREDLVRPENAEKLQGVEGFYNPKDGSITLIAESLNSPDHAQFVAWHELAHRKIHVSQAQEWHSAIAQAAKHETVRKLADAIQAQRKNTDDPAATNRAIAHEEAIAELYAAHETGDYEALKTKYEIKIPRVIQNNLGGFLARLGDKLARIWRGVIGHYDVDGADVFNLLRDLSRADVSGSLNTESQNPSSRNSRPHFGVRADLFDLPPIPITHIDTSDLPNNFKDMKILADKLLRDLQSAPVGTLHNDDMGMDLQINKTDRKKMGKNFDLTHQTSQSVSQLIDLVKNAIRAESHADTHHHNPDVKAVHRLYAPAEIDGKIYRVKLTVKDYVFTNGTEQKNLHAIEAAEIENAPMGTVPSYSASNDVQTAQPTSGRELSITDLMRGASQNNGAPFSGSMKRSQQSPREQYDQAKTEGKTELTFAQWQQVRTPEFKAWFGDWENDPENSSKVINPRTGEPLVVYHGGTFDVQAEHAIFDKNRQMQNHFESSGGFFFTDQKNSAEYYAGTWKPTPTGRVTETFLNIRKPIPSRVFNSYFDAVDTYDKFNSDIQSELSDETKGLDGVIYKAIDEDGDYDGALYVVTEPNQIKSATDNTGAFDPNNDDIRYSRGTSKDQIAQFAQTGKIEQDLGLIEAVRTDRTADYLAGKKTTLGKVRDFLVEGFADNLIKVSDWIDGLPIAEMQRELFKQSMYRAGGMRDYQNQIITEQFIQPMNKELARIAKKTKRPMIEVKRLVGVWGSANYAPTANARLLQRAKAELDQAKADGASQAKIDELQAAYNERQAAINGTADGKTAGGYSNPFAAEVKANIEKHLDVADIKAVMKHVHAMLQYKLDLDLKAGRISQEMYNDFKANKEYVPLTGDPISELQDENDFIGHSTDINQSRDKQMGGRSSMAEDAIDAAFGAIGKSTAIHGWSEFKNRLNDIYETAYNDQIQAGKSPEAAAKAVEKEYGITREKMQGTTRPSDKVIIHQQGGQYYAFRLNDKLTAALHAHNTEVMNAFLRPIATVTRGYARLVTQFTPSFAPVNAVRDMWEKSEMIRTFKAWDENGNRVDMDKVARGAIAQALNPSTMKQTIQAAWRNDFSSEMGQHLREFLAHGGVSTQGTMLSPTEQDLLKQIKKETGMGNIPLRKVFQYVESYNTMFDLVPSFSLYLAMRKHGISAEQAAGLALDTTNFRKKGKYMGGIRAVYMFAQPIATGAYNLARYLDTPTGKKRALAYVAAGIVLYSLLREMADEDEGGNQLDQMGDITRYIPIHTGNGKYIKIPVGFGLPQFAWNIATNSVKAAHGDISIGEAMGEIGTHWAKTIAPIAPSEVPVMEYPATKAVLTFTPSIFQPIVQNALNRNAFGTPIAPAFVNDKKLKAEQSKTTTAEFWRDAALWLQRFSRGHIDMHPEQIRNIVNGYGVSLIREGINYFIENPNAESLGKAGKTPFINALYGAGNEYAIQNRYFAAMDEAKKLQQEYESRQKNGDLGDWLTDERRKKLEWYKRASRAEQRVSTQKSRATRQYNKGAMSDETYRAKTAETIQKRLAYQKPLLNQWRRMENKPTKTA